MALQIVQVHPAAIEIAENIKIDLPAVAYIGVDDGEIVGSGGLAWGGQRCWIWLKVGKSKPEYAIPLMRQTRKLMAKARQFGDVAIFTPRDAQFETSEKLLTVLGFRPFSIENENEVWVNERT
jgi:hypothetical protein